MDKQTEQHDSSMERYARQIRYAPMGLEGQKKLCAARITIIGCGALGSVQANTLARAGVGNIRLVDRDYLELNNLQRQVLYDEDDVAAALPKSIAAANRLSRINSDVAIEPVVQDANFQNIEELCQDADVILDGTDNFETRFLINDYSLHSGIPWVYGGCVGSEGQSMTVIPGETPCLRCLMMDGPPPPGTTPTCDSAGILGPIVNIVASLQANEAIKLASGNREAINRDLTIIDLWSNRIHQMKLDSLGDRSSCPTCNGEDRGWLSGSHTDQTAVLCGRGAVQINPTNRQSIDLDGLAQRLSGAGSIESNDYLVRLKLDDNTITVFHDGRAIITGTDDPVRAKSLLARWIGV